MQRTKIVTVLLFHFLHPTKVPGTKKAVKNVFHSYLAPLFPLPAFCATLKKAGGITSSSHQNRKKSSYDRTTETL